MDILSSIILGAVQGLTEFLPVSSTGHLVLVRELLGLQVDYGLSVDAVLHLATALAVFIYFRKTFLRLFVSLRASVGGTPIPHVEKNMLLALVLGTIPAVFVGLFFEDYFSILRSPETVAWALLGGSIVFIAAEYVLKKNREKGAVLRTNITAGRGLAIGFFQVLALIPGMSRSGMTISGGLLLGLDREEAARFGFLLSFPIILGVGVMSMLDLGSKGLLTSLGLPLLVGGITAFITGWLAIHYLLKFLKNHTLGVFVVYRVALAAIIFVFLV